MGNLRGRRYPHIDQGAYMDRSMQGMRKSNMVDSRIVRWSQREKGSSLPWVLDSNQRTRYSIRDGPVCSNQIPADLKHGIVDSTGVGRRTEVVEPSLKREMSYHRPDMFPLLVDSSQGYPGTVGLEVSCSLRRRRPQHIRKRVPFFCTARRDSWGVAPSLYTEGELFKDQIILRTENTLIFRLRQLEHAMIVRRGFMEKGAESGGFLTGGIEVDILSGSRQEVTVAFSIFSI